MKLFFWGQFSKKELALALCTAWERQIGPAEHYEFRRVALDVGDENAIKIGIAKIQKEKPTFVINWQGHGLDKRSSKEIRQVCDNIGAKYVFISIDDPFYLHHWKLKPYKYAHTIITCCSEAREIYLERGTTKDIIFAPPPVSTDCHLVSPDETVINGTFYFFLNPYIGEIYKKYGALNRFETIREMLAKKIKVGLASNPQLRAYQYLSPEEWDKIDWKGFVPYEDFHTLSSWALHFNSSVVGKNYTYLNQRVFEILGIGGVQCLDVSPRLELLLKKFCAEKGIVESMPFIFYTTNQELAEKAEMYLKDPDAIARKREAARKLRGRWTYDHLVRRIALNEETFFDRFEKED